MSFIFYLTILSLAVFENVESCVATAAPTTTHATATTTTTTVACCPVLTTSSLPRVAPSGTGHEQCSILKRMSTKCPTTGLVLCDAAQETNPTSILIQFFNSSGTVVRSVSTEGDHVTATVMCINGVWNVATTSGGTTYTPISSVSCSQSGSTGTDLGNVISDGYSKIDKYGGGGKGW
ncbi:unnamed protein product [Caenorhabditis angaria]|uniref:C6 domain-containing protein n=1 Tax=Caenorhabditis angaria TaxID=860376 RepID=A0A9P1MV14_9PELO|nr:unnamed protein product [Caenorhabditis angaria]